MANGEFAAFGAAFSTASFALSLAIAMAGITVDVAEEPPDVGPDGSELSPSTTLILSTGMPVRSETISAKVV